MQIDQFLPSFAARDAIGYHTLELQKLIRSMGIPSEIYADEIKDEMKDKARPFKAFVKERYRSNRYLIYQASTGSPMVRTLIERHEPLLINFHNITPKEILGRWDIGVGITVGAGVKQLSMLKEKTIGAISVSEYNRWCLIQEGYKDSMVAAPFIPEPRPRVGSSRSDGSKKPVETSRWLFVGRITPNKAQHDIIKAFSAYLKGWNENASLKLIGSVSSDTYLTALKELIESLGISNKVSVTGPVNSDQLEHEYEIASVFVCLSDHEGFGFPLIEAMRHEIPVVAYGSTAVPETLGMAGILLKDKDPFNVAAAVALMESDVNLKATMISRSHTQLTRYSYQVAKGENLSALRQIIPNFRSAG